MFSISIAEAERAREQATRVNRITFLAFVFVPLSFPTGFFGMNVQVHELGNDRMALK